MPSRFRAETPWTLGALRRSIAGRLAAAGIEGAGREALWILADVTGLEPVRVLAEDRAPADPDTLRAALTLASRRATREPLQYVLGKAHFFGRAFEVGPSVLVPRPETEGLVERALAHVGEGTRVLDVGTGSGCVAITIALERPGARVTACDVSRDALEWAGRNAASHGARVRFRTADALDAAFGESVGAPYDVVVSNPPYVPAAEAGDLPPEVIAHEPHVALFSGDDPLRFHKVIANARLLVEGGWIVLEIHDGTEAGAIRVLRDTGFVELAAHEDLSGRPRVVEGRRG